MHQRDGRRVMTDADVLAMADAAVFASARSRQAAA
jgi:hypothetical protein